MSSTQPARGMRDFLPDQIRKREYVIGAIKDVYEKYGFEPLETPSIENLTTLTNKYGEEGDQLMYKILKRGEKLKKQLERDNIDENDLADLALRYDLTVPLARVVANYRHELPRFFKRYQIQPVWRADRPAKGRFREFYQCDVDAIGSKSMTVEAELISAVSEVLDRLGFDDFVIRINHRDILYAILDAFDFEKEQHQDALVALDKLDKVGIEGVSRELDSRGIDEGSKSRLLEYLDDLENLDDSATLSRLSEICKEHEGGRAAIRELGELFSLVDSPYVKIDTSLARGLSYYTGVIYEINVGDLSGSIASGGRYDGLIGMFGKEEIPAVGFSLGLERILFVMEQRGMFPQDLPSNAADVLVTVWNEESASESLKLAGELREGGLRVTVYPQADKLGKQFKYANQIAVPFVCVIGDDEMKANKVQLKNMKSGEQETLGREAVAEYLGRKVNV